MTWLLLIQTIVMSTCVPGYRFCPPAKPPTVQKMILPTEAACEARAKHYRAYLGERRELLRSEHLTMERVTTVRCIAQPKS